MANQETNKSEENPFSQILEKLASQEATIKAQQEQIAKMEAQFKDFSDFNKSLLNQGTGTPHVDADEKAKTERRQYLDNICRKGMMK